MHSRDLQFWLALSPLVICIKLVTEQTFHSLLPPALTDLSGRMLQSARILSQLVVFKSEIAFTSHMTSLPTDFFGHQ